MTIFDLYRVFSNYFRPMRMAHFWQRFGSSEARILDVGGYRWNWELIPHKFNVTLLNLSVSGSQPKNMTWVVGDGRYLPFKDGSFDVVYSNSVIEHLGRMEDQRLFALECMRVGKCYYIQTPDKRFFIEPHLITPFVHWLPIRAQRLLLRYFTVWGILSKPDEKQCDAFMNEIRLLDKRELQTLFPDADIWHERFCGMSKSLIAVKFSQQ